MIGDGVNIAARIQQLAQPGEIVVTSAVRDYVWNKMPVDLRRPGRARAEEHQPADPGLPDRAQDPARHAGSLAAAPLLDQAPGGRRPAVPQPRRQPRGGLFRRGHHRGHHPRPVAQPFAVRDRLELDPALPRPAARRPRNRLRTGRPLHPRGQRAAPGVAPAHLDGADRRRRQPDGVGGQVRRRRQRDLRVPGPHRRQHRGRARAQAVSGRGGARARASPPRASTPTNASCGPCRSSTPSTTSDFAEAGKYLQRAVSLDPVRPGPRVPGVVAEPAAGEGRSSDPAGDAERGRARGAATAVELDPNDAFCLAVAGHIQAFLHKNLDMAVDLFDGHCG